MASGTSIVRSQVFFTAQAAHYGVARSPRFIAKSHQWWVTTAGGHPAYAAMGFGGQLIEVVPDLRLVAVFSADVTEHDAPVDPYSYASILSLTIQQVEDEELHERRSSARRTSPLPTHPPRAPCARTSSA